MKFFNIGKKKKNLINDKVVESIIKDNKDFQWAINELKLAGYAEDDPNYKTIISALALLYNNSVYYGDASNNVTIVSKLINKEVLTPLRFTEEEWKNIDVIECGQNIRDKRFFRDKNYNIYSQNVFDIKYNRIYNCITKEWKDNKYYNFHYYAGIFEARDGVFTGRYFYRCFVKERDIKLGFKPQPVRHINCNRIQVNHEIDISVVNHEQLNLMLLNIEYDIDWKKSDCIKGVKVEDITVELLNKYYDECLNNKE